MQSAKVISASKNEVVKTAGNNYRYYSVASDPDTGRRLKKNLKGKYIYDGTGEKDATGRDIPEELYDPEEIGKAIRAKKLPVMSENDMMSVHSFPIAARTLKLGKYQRLIADLRTAASDSQTGIVNFVVGRETDMVDAILRAAFPPGSGVVYKGVEGYNINAANWGSKPEEAGQKLKTLLKGNVKSVSREEYDFIKQLDEDFKRYNENDKNTVKVLSPISILNGGAGPRPGPAAPVTRNLNPAPGVTATPATSTTAAPTPPSLIEQQFAIIESCELAIKMCSAKMAKLDRHDKNRTSPKERSQGENHDFLSEIIENYQEAIRKAREILRANWKTSDGIKETPYDGEGFLDFEAYKDLVRRLMAMQDPKKLYEHLMKTSKDVHTPMGDNASTPAVSSAVMAKTYEDYAKDITQEMRDLKTNATKDVSAAFDEIIKITEKPYAAIIAQLGLLTKKIQALSGVLRNSDKIMILNNVVEGCGLVAPHRGEGGEQHLVFTHTPLLTEELVSQDQRKHKRAMIVVSRVPINFNIGGVQTVPTKDNKDAMLVDAEEGAALVKYFDDKFKSNIKKMAEEWARSKKPDKGPVPLESMVSISGDDIKRTASVLVGKTQTDAIQFLTKIFKNMSDKKTGAINGRELVKEAIVKNNNEIINGASWSNEEGQTKGLYRKETKVSMDDYIYSLRTDWGTMVKRINDQIDSFQDMNNVQKVLAERLRTSENGTVKMSGADLSVLQTQVKAKEQEAAAQIQSLDHFIILYGTPGCGKSVYAQALANKLNFDLYDADFGQTRGSLVGQSERWFKAMLDSWKKMSNVVIRIDEIDGQVVGQEEEARTSHNANQIKQLLTYFEDDKKTLIENNIFVVATTNNPDRIRAALGNRADEVMRVPDINDADNYETFLNNICSQMKQHHPQGCIYDPDNYVRSGDLWPETEAFMETLKPNYPEMAKAVVNTGMNLRKLGMFVYAMLTQHMRYLNSQKKVSVYNENRKKFMEEYSSSVKRDKNGNVVSVAVPEISGIPFTSENFIRACQLTYPVNALQQRITMEERDADDQNTGNVHVGVNDLERELYNSRYNKSTAPEKGVASQPSLFDSPMMPQASEQTVASTDYYYTQLLKAGIIQEPSSSKTAQAQPPITAKTQETLRQWLMRVDKGDVTEDDVVQTPGCLMLPIPSKHKSTK